jgi:uncharacterized DUF497 family protein
MQSAAYEWDDEKALANIRKHGIRFEDAVKVFDDLGMLDDPDDAMDYGEDRFRAVGLVEGRLITV